MKCEELLKMLNDYVDGDIAPEVCEGFESHLAHHFYDETKLHHRPRVPIGSGEGDGSGKADI